MPATEAAVKVDGAALVVALGCRPSVRFVAEHNTACVRHFEPAFKPHDLRLENVWPAEPIPERRLTCMEEKVMDLRIYSFHLVRILDLDERAIRIAAAVLDQGSIVKPQHCRPFPHPFLE